MDTLRVGMPQVTADFLPPPAKFSPFEMLLAVIRAEIGSQNYLFWGQQVVGL